MTATETGRAGFQTSVTATGNSIGIVVPNEIIDELGAGKRPSVLVNGYEYRSTVGVMGGNSMISISAAVRQPSNSLQRYHVDQINAAKTAETRQRRIEKAISLLRDGKPR